MGSFFYRCQHSTQPSGIPPYDKTEQQAGDFLLRPGRANIQRSVCNRRVICGTQSDWEVGVWGVTEQ